MQVQGRSSVLDIYRAQTLGELKDFSSDMVMFLKLVLDDSFWNSLFF